MSNTTQTTRATEQLLKKMGMSKALDYLQGIFWAENVSIKGEFKGFPVRTIEHYGEKLEIRWKDKKEPFIFSF